jgi:hypothetical protein
VGRGRRAKLADDDAGGAVGDAHRGLEAITVSPAPVTSMTSRFSAATEKVLLPLKSVMPSSPRVRSRASSPSFAISACARAFRSFSSFQVPTTSRSSATLGVIRLAPL